MILETERLYLRTLEINDAIRMSQYRNKPEVAQFQSWKSYSIEDAMKRIEQCLKIDDYHQPRTDYHLAIISKEHNQMIGDLFVDVVNKRVFCLGYTLDSDYWSQGFAFEIVDAFLKYMKEEYHFQKAICYAYYDNVRSKNLLRKLGFIKFEESYYYGDEGFVKRL